MSTDRITDEEILIWILDGTLKIMEVDTERPVLHFRGRVQKPELNCQGGRRRIHGGARWRWTLRYNYRQRRIYCNKLVFMYVHRRCVGPGCVVHHGDKGSRWDGISNLTEMTDPEHKQHHYGA